MQIFKLRRAQIMTFSLVQMELVDILKSDLDLSYTNAVD